jgi:hypothetical protein
MVEMAAIWSSRDRRAASMVLGGVVIPQYV